MKKYILSLTILLAVSASSFAQDVKFGLKLGADIHKINGKPFSEQFSFGYHAGAFADIGITTRFGVQPEILFSQVNVDTSSSFSSVYQFTNISKVQLKYLKIPLLFNYSPNKFVALQLGPQFGILMDQAKDILKNGQSAFKQGDFSMLGGIQLKISKIRLYGRYAVGLNNINDIDNREKWKNQSIQVGLGYTF